MIPQTLLACLSAFEPCFTAPSYHRFTAMMSGWLLCIGKHTITGVMRSAGVAHMHPSGFHRFFSQGAWLPDDVGRVVLQRALKLVPSEQRVMLTLDDTLARHTGKCIASAGMHRDPLLSTGNKPFFHFGHNWVVLAVVVEMPWGKRFSLPFFARLYRSVKAAKKASMDHVKRTVMAAQMLADLATAQPGRRFLLVTDNAYVNRSIVRQLPQSIDLIGRGRMDAALYAPAPRYSGKGRPRVKGDRLDSPGQRAIKRRFKKLDVVISGRRARIHVQVFNALWYIVGGGRRMRFVIIRDWPGHAKDDVLVSTDLTLSAQDIVEAYCQRWSIEETFGWAKSRLGFEDAQNRSEHAVHRTTPMALWAYSLVVIWYANRMRRRKIFPFRRDRWYPHKAAPSFADMLASMRRECWRIWVSDLAHKAPLDQKSLAPLLDVAGYG